MITAAAQWRNFQSSSRPLRSMDCEKAEPFFGAAHESECVQRNGSSMLLVELERAVIPFAASEGRANR